MPQYPFMRKESLRAPEWRMYFRPSSHLKWGCGVGAVTAERYAAFALSYALGVCATRCPRGRTWTSRPFEARQAAQIPMGPAGAHIVRCVSPRSLQLTAATRIAICAPPRHGISESNFSFPPARYFRRHQRELDEQVQTTATGKLVGLLARLGIAYRDISEHWG